MLLPSLPMKLDNLEALHPLLPSYLRAPMDTLCSTSDHLSAQFVDSLSQCHLHMHEVYGMRLCLCNCQFMHYDT